MKSFFLTLLFPLISAATVSDFSVNSDTASTTVTKNSAVYIFGGVAGTCTGTSSSATCDSCTGGTPPTACNQKRVHGTLNLSVSFKSTESGQACIMTTGSSPSIVSGPTTYTAGSTVTMTVNWDTLCNEVTAGAMGSCSTAITSTYSKQYDVGIDTDGSCSTIDDKTTINIVVAGISDLSGTAETASIENFEVYPGDEKIYIRNISSYSSDSGYTPERGNSDVAAIGVFYAAGDCTSAYPNLNNASLSYFTPINSSGVLEDNRVRNLANGTQYAFTMAAKDEAGNIGFFTDPTGVGSTFACVNGTHTATPDEVFGLLTEEKNCFVATAAFGSILDPHVQTFRNFRDQYLRKSSLGKKFIGYYYTNSPPMAQFIAEREWLRMIVQAMLFPLWAVAYIYTQWGLWISNLILAFTIGLFFMLRKKVRAT